ncbi:MAG: RHS repeat-associated core domain-containing protein, partial [Cyclobacteriaceae bacterium]|nr:RHS repeat-associated core domain-containing protein [Cyclobacteriaceae bacterium]
SGYVAYTYDAAGTKLRKIAQYGANTDTTDYVGGIQYTDGTLDFLQHTEGRYLFTTSAYQYNLTDHLGNVRATVDATGTVVQRDDYYPFGLTFNSYTSGTENLYKYNGKEEQKETGWLDYGARMYDAALGRWNHIDPLAEKFYDWTPYNYTYNNPIRYIDLFGLEGEDPNEEEQGDEQKLIEYYKSLGYDVNSLDDVKKVVDGMLENYDANRSKAASDMWSDGGHWIGSGSEPDLFSSRIVGQSSETINYTFNDKQSVEKFNDSGDEQDLRLSVGAGALFSFITRNSSAGWLSGAGFGYGVSKLLAQGRTTIYPGYSIQVIVKSTTYLSSISGKGTINFEFSYNVIDECGKIDTSQSRYWSSNMDFDPRNKEVLNAMSNFSFRERTIDSPPANAFVR